MNTRTPLSPSCLLRRDVRPEGPLLGPNGDRVAVGVVAQPDGARIERLQIYKEREYLYKLDLKSLEAKGGAGRTEARAPRASFQQQIF